jgi:hypothetical protein
MSGYDLRPEALSDLSGRLTTAADDLGAAFGAVGAAPPDAGATTAALASVLDRVVLGVADVLGDLADTAEKLDATRATYEVCEEGNTGLFRRLGDLPWEGGR